MNASVDSQYLRSSGRTIEVPFQVRVNCEGRFSDLVCTRVLRVLPGKRLVCLGEWNHRQVVAKFFLDSGAIRHCAREERGIKALKEAGIKTPGLLFRGTLSPDNSPVLGFQRIMQAQDLSEAWEQMSIDDQRVTLLNRAVTVIADQHEAGLKQDDLHLGNFLLTGNDIYTIDGDAVDAHLMGNPLPQAKSLRNISLFFAQFHPRFDHLAPKAFQRYAKKRTWQEEDGLFSRLTKEIRNQRNHRKKNYLKKIYRECTAFVCRKTWHKLTICDRRFHTEEVVRFLTDPDTVVDSGRLLKDGNSSTVSLVELDGHCFVVKRYNIKNFWHGLKRFFRPSRAWISWRNAHRLSFILGIPTPKPIMLMEKRWGPFRSTAYFVMEYIEGIDIYHLLHANETKDFSSEKLTNLVGELLQSLAEASISHGDFKATNFVLSGEKLFVLDLDAMREHRFRCRFRRAFERDLNRFMQNWVDLPVIAERFFDQVNKLKI